MRRILCGLALLLFEVSASSSVAAQDNPQVRDGFWIGFGLGAGSFTCGGCSDGPHGGAAVAFRIGGTLSQRLLVGAQVDVWAHATVEPVLTTESTSFSTVAAAVYFYPVETSGAYVMGGIGSSSWTKSHGNTTEESDSAPGITLGAGYDWRVAKRFALSPQAALVVARLTVDGAPRTLTALNVGLGFTWP